MQLEHFQKAADVIAARIVGDAGAMSRIAPCADGAAPAECARLVVQKFGALAYRAPITDSADIERHVQLFGAGATTSYQHGIELLLRGMLQSPRFLYRVELGTDEKVSELAVKLSPHETAARLAYTLWDGPPDERLNEAARVGDWPVTVRWRGGFQRIEHDARPLPDAQIERSVRSLLWRFVSEDWIDARLPTRRIEHSDE